MPAAEQLELAWESSAEREKASRSLYAQNRIKKEDVATEVAEIRAALGTGEEVRSSPAARSAHCVGARRPQAGRIHRPHRRASAGPARRRDRGARPRHPRPVVFHDAPSAPRGEVALTRTDPVVAATARFVLDTALDESSRPGSARPSLRRDPYKRRTTAHHHAPRTPPLPAQPAHPRRRNSPQLAEEARVVAFQGRPEAPQWLPDEEALALLETRATGNSDPGFATDHIASILAALDTGLMDELRLRSKAAATELEASHHRVRTAARARLAGLKAVPQGDPDVLGVFLYRPAATIQLGADA
ncbi:hypothetical protein NKH77_19000 [Streptomyces sp. M19]